MARSIRVEMREGELRRRLDGCCERARYMRVQVCGAPEEAVDAVLRESAARFIGALDAARSAALAAEGGQASAYGLAVGLLEVARRYAQELAVGCRVAGRAGEAGGWVAGKNASAVYFGVDGRLAACVELAREMARADEARSSLDGVVGVISEMGQ